MVWGRCWRGVGLGGRTRGARRRGVRVIRRFTGGGTVVVDSSTLFVSLLMVSSGVEKWDASLPLGAPPRYPRDVMRWSAQLYRPVVDGLLAEGVDKFALQCHDYCLGKRKMGGNAQGLSRDRIVHHTSFLWDYDASSMGLLKMPPEKSLPPYRAGRGHGEFVTKLRDGVRANLRADFAGAHELFRGLADRLQNHYNYDVVHTPLGVALEGARRSVSDRIATEYVDL
jgi:lipoate-protein ligase A